METFKSTWLNAGKLSCLKTDFSAGVYLFVHEGPLCRIIYVGTAEQSVGFTRRWCEHLSLLNVGGRTVWRPTQGTDVYSLMTLPPGEYEKHCNEASIWIPGKKVNGILNF